MARRGAGNINYEAPEEAEKRAEWKQRQADRKAKAALAAEEAPATRPSAERPDRSLPNADDLERTAAGAVKRGRRAPTKGRKPLPARPHPAVDPAVSLRKMVGEARAKSLMRRLGDAGKAFGAERFDDARRMLLVVVKEAPALPEGRELLGLVQYRTGRWKEAITQLEAFRELSGSTEQHPVLADCYRALERWHEVDALWDELGEASPRAELVVEGRIVVAGSWADRGEVERAIRILEQGWQPPKRPRDHHLRRAYALADLYDRIGRTPRARELFKWVSSHDPEMADVTARIRTLG